MHSVRRWLLGLLFMAAALPANAATVLIIRFHNASPYSDLSWVGESISETLFTELSATNLIVIDRDTRSEAMKRLSLRAQADFTKATIIRLGQSVDADYVIYGTYSATQSPASPVKPAGSAPASSAAPGSTNDLRNSLLNITARMLDLRHFHDGPEVTETGKLADLARLEEHLSWQHIKILVPDSNPKIEDFMAPQKIIRVDAQESYVRGLLSASKESRQKWFTQAMTVDPHFISPSVELGKLLWEKKEYRAAIQAFQHVPSADRRYPEVRFRMGLCAYDSGEYSAAAGYFREVAKTIPLNEVFNNLGAAELALNQPAALEDFRKAYDGDPNDAMYAFNLGVSLLRQNQFDEAVKHLTAAADHDSTDDEAETMLAIAQDKARIPTGTKAPPRLKLNFDATAFRELKAMLSPKS